MSPARHPRAGLATGALVLLGWLAALGAALADDGSTTADRLAASSSRTSDAPVARPGRAGPGYQVDGAD